MTISVNELLLFLISRRRRSAFVSYLPHPEHAMHFSQLHIKSFLELVPVTSCIPKTPRIEYDVTSCWVKWNRNSPLSGHLILLMWRRIFQLFYQLHHN